MTVLRQLNPLQWNDLPDIDRVPPISEEDEACLQEIKTVLEKHGRLSRFGIALLHNHFSLNEDEMMLEVCDKEKRTLVSKPVNRDLIDSGNIIETLWRFDPEEVGMSCAKRCWKLKGGGHQYQHEAFPPDDYDKS